MRVLLNKVWYDSALVPIMLLLEENDRSRIRDIKPIPASKKEPYLCVPPTWTHDDLQKFLTSDEFKERGTT